MQISPFFATKPSGCVMISTALADWNDIQAVIVSKIDDMFRDHGASDCTDKMLSITVF